MGVKFTILPCMFGRLESGHVASGPEVLLAVNSLVHPIISFRIVPFGETIVAHIPAFFLGNDYFTAIFN